MLQWVRWILISPDSNTANYLSRVTGCPSVVDYFACKRPDNPGWVTDHKFYAKMQQVWNKFHSFQPTDERGIRHEVLWHNRWITSGGSPLQMPSFQRAGVKIVSDICHETEPRTLSHTELNNKFDIGISFLDMMRIRQSPLETELHSKLDSNATPTLKP